MRLVSRQGGYVELRPVAYQAEMPEPTTADDDDGIDEWLVIGGGVRLGDGREWAFSQPCLTTSEAQSLGVWLASAGEGRIAPSPAVPPGRELLCFTEPNIALSIAGYGAGRVTLRVHFSHESMPPWHPHNDWPDYHAYFIVLDVSAAGLTMAARQWDRDLRAFPARASTRHQSREHGTDAK